MFNIVLYEPEIPANTGNIGRLCLATGAGLHLAGRLGFSLDDRSVRRAGVDHWADVAVKRHVVLADFERDRDAARLFCFSTKGTRRYTEVSYQPGDSFIFGSESRGLPPDVLERHAGRVLLIPMPGPVRSLNLANAVSIVVYEALRQVMKW